MTSQVDPSTFDDPALPDLVAAAMGELDDSGSVDVEAICGDRSDLVEAVRASLHDGTKLKELQHERITLDRGNGRILVDRYRLGRRLGSGAMGVVHAARDLDLGRPVAVKILRLGLVGSDSAELRFAREAAAMAAVRHRATITVHDRGRTDDGEAFLVMERLEGRTLRDLLDTQEGIADPAKRNRTGWVAAELGVEAMKEPSFLRASVAWAADLASGLSAAHAAGVLHRDVKPSNIFVRRDGTPVLLDFGIAGLADGATITGDGATVGTPAYMAPEALSHDGQEGPGLDVYGLAATLYHLVTGKAPYRGSPSQILARLATTDPAPPHRVRRDLPRDLRAILERGMARRASDRYPTAAALEADLRAFLEHRPVSARPIPAALRTWRRLQRASWFWALVGVAVIALGGMAWSQRQAQRARADRAIYFEAERQLPPNLSFGAPHNRVLPETSGREHVRQLLDTMVEHHADPVPPRLARANFLLDHGDPRGAAADVAAIARALGTPYAQALASRYSKLPAGASSSADLSLEDLPEPESPGDLYLDAVHAFRADQAARFVGRLRDERLDGYPGVALLRALVTAGRDADAAYDQLVALEEAQGGASAATLFQRATARQIAFDWEASLPLLEQSLELAPHSFRTYENVAMALWALGQYDSAEQALLEAIRLNPVVAKPHLMLARVKMSAGDLAGVERALAEGLKRPLTSQVERDWAASLPAELLAERAVQAFRSGDVEQSRRDAAAALEAFAGIRGRFFEDESAISESALGRRLAAESLMTEAPDLFGCFLSAATETGLQSNFVGAAMQHVPEDLAPTMKPFLEAVLHRMSRSTFHDPFETDAAPKSD